MGPVILFSVFALPGAIQGLAIHLLISRIDQGDSDLTILAMLIFAMVAPFYHHLSTSVAKRIKSLFTSVSLGLLCAGLVYWTMRNHSGESWLLDQQSLPLLIPILCCILISYISLPFYHTITNREVSVFDYTVLFERAWGQTVCFLIGGAFALVVLMIIMLSVALFKLLGIDLHGFVFRSEVLLPLIGGAFGLSIGISRQRETIIHSSRVILLALLRALLPVFAIVSVLFVISAIITGIDNIGSEVSVTLLLILTICLSITLTNGAVQDEASALKGNWDKIVRLQSLILPFIAAIAVYGLWIRIDEYGLTHTRVLVIIASAVALFYALGYGLAALTRSLAVVIQRVNTLMALVLLALGVLLMTPVLDVYRIAVGSQVAAFKSGKTPFDELDLAYLKYFSGLAGVQAIQEVRDTDVSDEFQLQLDAELTRIEYFHDGNSRPPSEEDLIGEFNVLIGQGNVKLHQIEQDPNFEKLIVDEAFLSSLRRSCKGSHSQCVVYQTAEFGFPSFHYLLALSSSPNSLQLLIFFLDELNQWQSTKDKLDYSGGETLRLPPDSITALFDDLAAGQLTTIPVTVQGIQIDGTLYVPPSLHKQKKLIEQGQ